MIKEMRKIHYNNQLIEISEPEQLYIVGGNSKGKVSYWKNVYNALIDLFGFN